MGKKNKTLKTLEDSSSILDRPQPLIVPNAAGDNVTSVNTVTDDVALVNTDGNIEIPADPIGQVIHVNLSVPTAGKIIANTAKISYDDKAKVAKNVSDIATNTTGISTNKAAISINTAKISYTDKAKVDANTAALAPIKAAGTKGSVLTRIGTGNNFGWQKPGGGLKVGDYRISSNSVKSCSPYEAPCNMGLLTLDVETYPELAEVYEVTEGTFKAAITAGDFVRNVGGNAKPLNEHQEDTFKAHEHFTGVALVDASRGVYGSTKTGAPGKARMGLYSNDSSRSWQTLTSNEGGVDTSPKNTTKNFFEITATVYNYEAYAEHKDAELQTVYSWDEETKEYIYQTDSPINFIESTKDKIVYWVERADLCTSIKPLEVKEGFAICIKDDKWEYKEDHRDEIVYLKVDGSPFTIEKIGKIDNKYTTIVPPVNVQYYKFTDKWELDADTKLALITTITKLIKLHTEKSITDELWELPVEDEGKFESEYEQFRYSSREDAIANILLLKDKTMEELIALLSNENSNN